MLQSPSKSTLHKCKLCMRIIPGYSMVNIPVLFSYYDLAQKAVELNIPGDLVECGVWNGGSAALMAKAMDEKDAQMDVWLFDSFEGVPEPTEEDDDIARKYFYPGWLKGTAENVRKIFDKLHLDKERLHIIEGWFESTLPNAGMEKISILHIDADWYESVKFCLEELYEKISPGGFVILNDFDHWIGCNKAVIEFIDKHALDVTIHKISKSGAYFQKPG